MPEETIYFVPPLSHYEQEMRKKYSRYKVGDAVIVNTAHLTSDRNHYCPESNSYELYLNPSMVAKSGQAAFITDVEPCRYGDFYTLSIQNGFVYTTDFLLPAASLTNKQLSPMFLEES